MKHGVRLMRGAVEREKAELGFFVTLQEPTAAMEKEALAAGFYSPPILRGKKGIRALQIRTIGELLDGNDFDFPLTGANVSFATAQAMAQKAGQEKMEL